MPDTCQPSDRAALGAEGWTVVAPRYYKFLLARTPPRPGGFLLQLGEDLRIWQVHALLAVGAASVAVGAAYRSWLLALPGVLLWLHWYLFYWLFAITLRDGPLLRGEVRSLERVRRLWGLVTGWTAQVRLPGGRVLPGTLGPDPAWDAASAAFDEILARQGRVEVLVVSSPKGAMGLFVGFRAPPDPPPAPAAVLACRSCGVKLVLSIGVRVVKVKATNAAVTTVFHSGTRGERSVRAEILATDDSRDPAVLRVRGVGEWPRPITLEQKARLVETMPVYILGFPFGEAVAGKKGNPAITINKGSVSSLRENDFGQMRAVQIDGAINPGTLRADLGAPCSWLSPSAEGLLVAVSGLQEVWVIDPLTFKTKRKIPAPQVDRVASAPSLAVAFAAARGGFPGQNPLSVLDLKTGQIVKQYQGRDLAPNGVGFQFLTATPDGKYLFSVGGIEQLHRFRIKGQELVFEESSQRIAQNGQAIEVSPDGKYVCLPSGGGNYGAANYSTFVYAVTNLSTPVVTIQSGAYPRALAFDPKGNTIYAHNFQNPLILLTPKGIKLKGYAIPGAGEVKQILPHPQGGKLLLLTGHRLHLVGMKAAKGADAGSAPVGLGANEKPGAVAANGPAAVPLTEANLAPEKYQGKSILIDHAQMYSAVIGRGSEYELQVAFENGQKPSNLAFRITRATSLKLEGQLRPQNYSVRLTCKIEKGKRGWEAWVNKIEFLDGAGGVSRTIE
jgi:hypothetical protein